MKIIILGAGQVGGSVAASLARERNDVTVVDLDGAKLRELQDKYDLRGVIGNASHPDVLARAGAEDADMLIAVTSADEINMVACQVAYTIFKTPLKIARVRAQEYLNYPQLFSGDNRAIDVLISPEQLVVQHIRRLIEYPGALQILDFAGGRAQLVAVRAFPGGPLVGHELKTLRDHLPKGADTRAVSIFRKNKPIAPTGETKIEVDDVVFFFAAKRDIKAAIGELRHLEGPVRRVILAGGGNIGLNLAKALEEDCYVKVVERSKDRAKAIAEQLERAIVLIGDAADEDLLREENIDQTDVFCALTNDDEANVLSSMLAKRMGANKVLSLINRPAYADLVETNVIDIAVSPQQVTLGALLTYVRRGHVVRVHSLRRGAAEAIEVIAHGDRRSSKVVGRNIEEIELPPGTTIGGIVRGEKVLIAHHNVKVETDDHVVLFVNDKRHLRTIEQLFQVSAAFV
jgi:trk system potassium uptake protein